MADPLSAESLQNHKCSYQQCPRRARPAECLIRQPEPVCPAPFSDGKTPRLGWPRNCGPGPPTTARKRVATTGSDGARGWIFRLGAKCASAPACLLVSSRPFGAPPSRSTSPPQRWLGGLPRTVQESAEIWADHQSAKLRAAVAGASQQIASRRFPLRRPQGVANPPSRAEIILTPTAFTGLTFPGPSERCRAVEWHRPWTG